MSTTAPQQSEQSAVDRQIARAHALERQRAELQQAIAANRTYLRLMAANDELNAAQRKWLTTFYPMKEKGEQRSEEEIAATRKAREAARKDGN